MSHVWCINKVTALFIKPKTWFEIQRLHWCLKENVSVHQDQWFTQSGEAVWGIYEFLISPVNAFKRAGVEVVNHLLWKKSWCFLNTILFLLAVLLAFPFAKKDIQRTLFSSNFCDGLLMSLMHKNHQCVKCYSECVKEGVFFSQKDNKKAKRKTIPFLPPSS